ncbi:MAG: S-methyl-5-thioribose-1-phosphate isomerase [Proteobacteria bacterium]|nr:S-methyl-5-thioribose-1-phosphate isomerase [Pseudomonadota bacterium]MBU4581967.1 S-methyl-5-thioribose-1-phosphate isomerase [Pseudomonadota bacterium]
MEKDIRTVFWENDTVVMIDQRELPLAERYVTCTDYREVVAAIKDLTIRGAPAIGVAAAMGIALGVRRLPDDSPAAIRNSFNEICKQFAATRPTARNLFWAMERMRRCFDETLAHVPGRNGESRIPTADSLSISRQSSSGSKRRAEKTLSLFPDVGGHALMDGAPVGQETAGSLRPIREALIAEAIRIGEEDIAINRRLGENGRDLIPDGARILTHCNAGALATAGYGTALGIIRAAWEEGKKLHVYVDETRPVLQGARLTAWELMRDAIPCTLIADNMAGFLMQRREVDLVIVGADRIAANGDTANKIGTYALAVLARAHGIPLYIAAPLSTIDPALADGKLIPIEERDSAELTHCGGVRIAPEEISVWNPAFDVTPHDLITAFVTEAGVIRPPFAEGIRNSWSSPA